MNLIRILFVLITIQLTFASKIKVIVSTYPLEYLAQKIGESFVEIDNPVPIAVDPPYWKPTRDNIAAMHKADVVILNGASYEKWLDKVTLPTSKTLLTAENFKVEFLTYQLAITHSHGKGKEHTHKGIDGHTWMDPVLFLKQGEAIRDYFSKLQPENSKSFAQGFINLKQEFNVIDEAFKNLCAPNKLPTLIMNHPAYDYLAKRYQWKVFNLDLSPEETPNPAQLKSFETLVKQTGAKQLIWESQPLTEVAASYSKSNGIQHLVFSPAETLSEAEKKLGINYLKIMTSNLQGLKSACPDAKTSK